jgi:hypothetical protein
MELVAAELGSAIIEQFHHHRKRYCAALPQKLNLGTLE